MELAWRTANTSQSCASTDFTSFAAKQEFHGGRRWKADPAPCSILKAPYTENLPKDQQRAER